MKLFAISLLATAVTATAASGSSQIYRTFKTPTGNIRCAYEATRGHLNQAVLRCDIGTGLKPRVRRPKGCDFDFGSTLILPVRGRARIGCVSDAIAPVKRVLRYGQDWRAGPFLCASKRAGLYCSNRSGNAFFLSKQRWYRYRF